MIIEYLLMLIMFVFIIGGIGIFFIKLLYFNVEYLVVVKFFFSLLILDL